MSVSLDGFVALPDHEIDWLSAGLSPDHGDQRHRLNLELLGQIGLIVLGSRACEDMAPAWSPADSAMGELMTSLPKLVFSQRLESVEWDNLEITRRSPAEEIPERKREGGKDMVLFGGARLASSMLAEGLFDELRLTVHPVALGDGLSFWRDLPQPQRFELVSSTAYADGTVAQVLRPSASGVS